MVEFEYHPDGAFEPDEFAEYCESEQKMSNAETIDLDARLEELMDLSPANRLELADRLVVSVGGFASPEVEKAWLDEADRRYAELKSGKEVGIPAAQAIEEVRRELHDRRDAASSGPSRPA